MHEYSIVGSLLAQVEDVARKHEAARVVAVRLRIGELAGVETDLLHTAWDFLKQRSCCDGARLEVESAPVRWSCRGCQAEIARGGALVCERCGAPARLASGDELLLERVEMEVETTEEGEREEG